MNEETGSKPYARHCENLTTAEQLRCEFHHLQPEWTWLLAYGIFLTACGAVDIVLPALISLAALIIVTGTMLLVGGIATIVVAFWAGRWSGTLFQILAGILYITAAFVIYDLPLETSNFITLSVAGFFIILGAYRIVTSMILRFPYWGWALLNGIVTFVLALMIFRHYNGVGWILGLLVGLELLLHGWTWITLAWVIRNIPPYRASTEPTAPVL